MSGYWTKPYMIKAGKKPSECFDMNKSEKTKKKGKKHSSSKNGH